MSTRAAPWFRRLSRLGIAILGVAVFNLRAEAAVNVHLRPPSQQARVGEVVTVELQAVSDNATSQSFSSLSVILQWDPTRLRLMGLDRSDEQYSWINSFFPNDATLDGLNADCAADRFCTPYSGVPFNDGLAYYEAWSAFSPSPPAFASQSGLRVVRFRFFTIRSGTARLHVRDAAGNFTRTRVLHGTIPGLEITGTLGPPVQVNILSCATPPVVTVEGGRYLRVSPASSEVSVALYLEADPEDDAIACVAGYLHPDGVIDDEPEFQTTAAWGTLLLSGAHIRPMTRYSVQSDCGLSGSADFSVPVMVRTWVWGDVTGEGAVDTDDILLVLDGSAGVFSTASLQNMDLAGCVPNGIIDTEDVLAVLDAAGGFGYGCPDVCENPIDLGDYAAMVSCLAGPDRHVLSLCWAFDWDDDLDVDLHDLQDMQNLFGSPTGP